MARDRNANRGLRELLAGPSDGLKVQVVLGARVLGQDTEVMAEHTALKDGKALWRFSWRCDLGSKTLDDIVRGFVPGVALPDGLGSIQPGCVQAQYMSGPGEVGLCLGLEHLQFLYLKDKAHATCWGLVYDKPIEIALSGMVAQLFGKQLRLRDLRIGSVSNGFDGEFRTHAMGQLPAAKLLLHGQGEASGFVSGIVLEGPRGACLDLPGAGSEPSGDGKIAGQTPATGGTSSSGKPSQPAQAPPNQPDSSEGFRKWFSVNKSLGPVRLDRLGCEWHEGKVGVLLDAAIHAGPLRLGLAGLAVRLPPSDPKPKNLELDLEGIDVTVKSDVVTISGGLVKTQANTFAGETITQYDGMVLLQAAGLSITGLGSYASVAGEASLFLFAALHKELGGPPCFRVNGLAAGFGYNRKLKLPPIEEVESFPLLRAAADENYFTEDGKASVQTALSKLRNYIPASPGDYWFSVGVRFSSFEMIQTTALLSISFGTEVCISILGLSRLTVPTRLPKDTAPLCYAELALRAEFNPKVGVLSAEARLTSNSYILDKACKLTGGFAFYCWLAGEHKGDFVVTLGGYHPRFQPPSHYPLVPRLGVDWVVSPQLHISGQLYFALTPSCLMAGGKLSAVYDGGWVKAWFVAYADFLVGWKPFHYDVAVGVSIGASATVRVNLGLFKVSKTFTFELGANLHLWGPPFQGEARVRYYIVSFSIRFGAGGGAEPKPILWNEFAESFLPGSESVCSASFAGGLLREWVREVPVAGKMSSDGKPLAIRERVTVVNAHELAIKVQSQVPCTAITNNGRDVEGSKTKSKQLGIVPMFARDLESPLRISVAGNDGTELPAHLFSADLITRGFPDALWGNRKPNESFLPQAPSCTLVKDVPAGVVLRLSDQAKQSRIPRSLPTMSLKSFCQEKILPKSVVWPAIRIPDPDLPDTSPTLSDAIWRDAAVAKKRAKVLAALAKATPHHLNEVALPRTAKLASDEALFQASPRPVSLGRSIS